MRYVHTNLIARDWRTLAVFYENVSAACEFSRSAILKVNQSRADRGSRALESRAFICVYPDSGTKVPRWKYSSTRNPPTR